jgi:DNA-binding phage protein
MADDAKLIPFDMDISKLPTDNEATEFYLSLVLENGDGAEFKKTIGCVAKAKGMIAKGTSVNKETLQNS